MSACCGDIPQTVGQAGAESLAHHRLVLSVPDIHCGACVRKIEDHLSRYEDVLSARVNLTLKRVTLELAEGTDEQSMIDRLAALSFAAYPMDDDDKAAPDLQAQKLLRALAVAGFGAANIMLLSVSAWSGADGTTRDLFHLISAVIAVPVVAFSGQVFFRSALGALTKGHVNMDVPISLAVILALGMSLFETMRGAPEAYFDAAIMLLFFLLIGRHLDQMMRAKARQAVRSLAQYAAKYATEILPDGTLQPIAVADIQVGTRLRLFAGARVPADCRISHGVSDVDRSMVTGESQPDAVAIDSSLEAGTLNLTGALDAIATKTADQSFIAEVTRLLDAAENGRGHYTQIADRMARIYTPAVHALALLAFISWMAVTGGDWHQSLLIAISVLIVTCPCALGLAVPVTHVVAASRLFGHGILMRDGAALERLAEIDQIAFDKTGTLTMGMAMQSGLGGARPWHAPLKALAMGSSHPASIAIVQALASTQAPSLDGMQEVPGLGLEAQWQGKKLRLGRADWVAEIAADGVGAACSGTSFAMEGAPLHPLHFDETLRDGAREAAHFARNHGFAATILSGDRPEAVALVAQSLGIEDYHAALKPAEKLAWIQNQRGAHICVVGDGINDAPALAAAHVSFAPASASDVGRSAADFIFTRKSLTALPIAHDIALNAGRIVRQNFGLALAYNCVAVPLAFMGYVTPLVAAIAMSASSILVIGNALRLAAEKPFAWPKVAVRQKTKTEMQAL